MNEPVMRRPASPAGDYLELPCRGATFVRHVDGTQPGARVCIEDSAASPTLNAVAVATVLLYGSRPRRHHWLEAVAVVGEDLDVEIDETRLVVRGELDMFIIAVLDRTIASFEGRLLEIDRSGVSVFGSEALAVLVRALRRNPAMRVVACSPQVLQVLQVTDTLALLTGQHTARNVQAHERAAAIPDRAAQLHDDAAAFIESTAIWSPRSANANWPPTRAKQQARTKRAQ